MDIAVQKLYHLRASLAEHAKTEDGNYLPMIVDYRMLTDKGGLSDMCKRLALNYEFVAVPQLGTMDVMVFDKKLYVSLRNNTCTDETVLAIYSTINNDLNDMHKLDEFICLES